MAEPERLRRREEPYRPMREEESIRDIAQEMFSDIGDLLHSELQLARSEIKADISNLQSAFVMLTIGGMAAFLGLMFLLLAAVFALSNTMTLGLASLIVGGVVLIVGGIVAWIGWGKMKSITPVPEQTVDTLQEDVKWLRNKMR